ncbi:unnamed protein product, partial [marine sediment metagenome]
MKKRYKVYVVPFLEDGTVLQKRLEILSENNIPIEIINISNDDPMSMTHYLHKKLPYYCLKAPEFEVDNYSDCDFRNAPGYVAAAIINQKAR